mmetsp:Transcript_12064/g.19905  ORF Transcript_12064/g.19905 Transcript_12064/m.19905 type:complete len:278 (+) Transcript_12064:133-966(+)
MPSNKKIRGRARKAKAKEKKSGIDEDFSLLIRRFQPGRSRGECMHGFPSGDGINIIYDILNTVVEVICISERRNDRVGGAFEAARQATVDKYPSLYNDAATLGLLSKAFLCTATELLLDRRAGTSTHFQLDIKAKNLFRCATLLAFAEYLSQYVKVKLQFSKPFFYYHKVHELVCSDERRMVSYTRKRIDCSCLDAKFLLVKSDKKISICNNLDCLQEKVELKALMTCERCRKAHYCSTSCQAVDYEGHKFDCVGWKKWKKLQKKTAVKPQDEFVDI